MVVVRRDGIILAKRLCSGKVVVFWQNGCIQEKTVVFGQIGYFRAKWFFSGKKWLKSEKVVVFWQELCSREKVAVSGKVFVLVQDGCIRT